VLHNQRAILTALAGNVARHRRAKGMSKKDLAAAAGVDVGTVRDLEQGRYNTTILTLVGVADALDVDIDELLWRPAAVGVQRS
jgi:transcriptional regulator with XRE-family HTH domain